MVSKEQPKHQIVGELHPHDRSWPRKSMRKNIAAGKQTKLLSPCCGSKAAARSLQRYPKARSLELDFSSSANSRSSLSETIGLDKQKANCAPQLGTGSYDAPGTKEQAENTLCKN